jgi:transcriptional regulator with XRE-family HTH domain
MESFGHLLRQARLMSGLTQEELALRAGLSVRAIGDLERGRTNRPHPRSARLLADALELTPDAAERLSRAARAGWSAVSGGRTQDVRNETARHTPRPAAGVVAQLPADVADFIGRDGLIEVLCK